MPENFAIKANNFLNPLTPAAVEPRQHYITSNNYWNRTADFGEYSLPQNFTDLQKTDP